jgi:hypothetical protein
LATEQILRILQANRTLKSRIRSISIIVDERKVDQSKRYCVLGKGKRKNYHLHCWTGRPALESPTKWHNNLKIRFVKNSIFFKFGRKKIKYNILNVSEEEYLLIKMKK